MKLGKRDIKDFGIPYIIAEIGANHNGDMSLAIKLIDSAKSCGCDAVKFQSWTPDSLISQEEYDRNKTYEGSKKKHFGSLKEMVDKYYLRDDQHLELKNYCDRIDIDFCSTPFSIGEADLLDELDVPFYKVASMDINHLTLLEYVATKNKPILLSTGMSSLAEIERAIQVIESAGNGQIILLHCIALYPPALETINLNNIPMLRKAFGYPVGFSDHTIGTSIPLASIALGSCIIEKHFTLDKSLPGWDHEISADPVEMAYIVTETTNVVRSLGTSRRQVRPDEEEKKMRFRRSMVAKKYIQKGSVINESDICFKRPGTGIKPDETIYVINRRVNRNIPADELIRWDDLQ